MEKQKEITKFNLKRILEMADLASDIDLLVEKLNLLSCELCLECDKINLQTAKGRITAELDLNIMKTKSYIICDYVSIIADKTKNLLNLSQNTLEALRQNEKLQFNNSVVN